MLQAHRSGSSARASVSKAATSAAHILGAMAPGRQGLRPGPGTPGARGRLPGWRRRGCRRPPRTWRTARSRRSATGRLRPAVRFGPAVDARRGQHRVPELGVLPPAEGALGQELLAQSVQGQRVGPAGPAPFQRVPGEVKGHLAGERVVARVQGRKAAQHLDDVSVAGQPVERGATGSHGVLGSRPLPAGHITTVDQNRQAVSGLRSCRRRQDQQTRWAPAASSR
jgi:hypothetical protein